MVNAQKRDQCNSEQEDGDKTPGVKDSNVLQGACAAANRWPVVPVSRNGLGKRTHRIWRLETLGELLNPEVAILQPPAALDCQLRVKDDV